MRDSKGVEEDGDKDHGAYAMYTPLDGGTRPFWWRVDYCDITWCFRPDLGYIPRRDVGGPGFSLRYREYAEQGPFKWVSTFSEIDYYEDRNGHTSLRDFVEGAGMGFRNEVEFWYIRGDRFHAPFQNWYDRVRIEYNEEVDIWDSVSASFAKGVYEGVKS